jgi:hypothetical protein
MDEPKYPPCCNQCGGNALKCRCGHGKDKHTTDAPMDYMGCTECGCSEFQDTRPGPRVKCQHCDDTHHVDQQVCSQASFCKTKPCLPESPCQYEHECYGSTPSGEVNEG